MEVFRVEFSSLEESYFTDSDLMEWFPRIISQTRFRFGMNVSDEGM